MKSRLSMVIFLALVAVGGLFLLSRWNSNPVLPAIPSGSGEQSAPSASAQVTQKDEPLSPQSSATGKDATPGTATGTATAIIMIPNPKPGTSQPTPTPANPILKINPTMTPIEGVVGKTPTPPGRLAPDFIAAPLKFEQIRIFMKDTGVFSGIANVSNSGETFLNGLVIQWRIVDKSGIVLDQGWLTWPNLAPGETATVSFDGTNSYSDQWEKVTFELEP